eukprot:7692517-Pyramimonas_sp.AAC.1
MSHILRVLSAILLLELPLCGRGWGFNALSSGTNNNLEDIWMYDSQFGWAVGRFDTVLRTQNGWTSSTLGGTSLGQDSNSIGIVVYDWYGVSFQNETHGWVVGSSGMTAYTTDGGVSFTAQVRDTSLEIGPFITERRRPSSLTRYNLRLNGSHLKKHFWVHMVAVHRTSTCFDTHGFCTQVSGVSSNLILHDVQAVGEGAVFACGDGGSVTYTSNYGATWTKQRTIALLSGGMGA